jgi:tight adherence protein B
MQHVFTIILLALVAAAAVTLWLDGRQRRIDRHVAIAVSTAHSESMPSVRRAPVESRWEVPYRVANYKPGITYSLRPAYVLLVGAIAAGAVLYSNSYVGLSLPYVSLAVVVVAIGVVRGLFGWQRRRLANRLLRQLPDAIAIVTSAVRSGLPMNEAFRTLACEMPEPTAEQFAIVCSELALGRPPEEAIEDVFRRTEVAEYGFFAVTLGVQTKAGGSLAGTLQTLADTVRERVALAARAKALAGEVIFSSKAISVSPVIIGGLVYLTNRPMLDVLFNDPFGKKLLAFSAVTVLVGTLVIRWMIRRDTAL